MHPSNILYWDTCKKRFPELFKNRRVVEFGSYDVNGTVRDYFDDCTYLGVDWRDGPGVDHVCLAHEFDESMKFDTVISTSMLEHDPYWEKSLHKMVDVLTDDGALLLSWGSALNLSHEEKTCPDYDEKTNPKPFHPRPVRHVLDLLDLLGMHVQESRYEFNVWKDQGRDVNKVRKAKGFAVGIFFKNKDHVRVDERVVDTLYPEDMGMKLPKLRGKRYQQLYMQLSDLLDSRSRGRVNILEIGTYDGSTAIGLMDLCHSRKCEPFYTGVDLFESMTKERQKEEIGKSKMAPRFEKVEKRIRDSGYKFRLFHGDSRKILPDIIQHKLLPPQDFIFIDGGHSIETVTSDWFNCHRLMHDSTVVLFDDYYHHDHLLGPRPLIDGLMECEEFNVELLDLIDKPGRGMKIGMAKLVKANS